MPSARQLDLGAAVGAVVVNYNAKDLLLGCVASLVDAGVGPVVVADNGSSDGSELALLERFPGAKWAPTGGNLGYGRAANIGAKQLATKYLLVCNPDVVVHPAAVDALRSALDARDELALVGPRVIDAEGALYPSARRFPDLIEALGHAFVGQFWPRNPFTRAYRMQGEEHARARDADWVSGSCFMVKRRAWESVGGFDARYFMYMEDVDLCWRLRKAGWAVAYNPDAVVVHIQGASTARRPYRMLVAHHISMWQFACRSASGRRRLVLPLVLPGVALRLGVALATRSAGRLPGALARALRPSARRGPATAGSGEGPPGMPPDQGRSAPRPAKR